MNIPTLKGKMAVALAAATASAALAAVPLIREISPQEPQSLRQVAIGNALDDQPLNPRKLPATPFARKGRPIPPLQSAASADVARRAAASGVKLRGSLIYDNAWYSLPSGTKFPYGVYEMSTTQGDSECTPVKLDPRLYVMDAVYTGDKYWITHAVEDPNTYQVKSMTYYTFNPTDWSVIKEQVGDKDLSLTTSTWVEAEEMAYCSWFENFKHIFGFLSIDDGQKYQLGQLENRLLAMASLPDGTIYAINDKGTLVTLNRQTGKVAKTIGQTGLTTYSRTSAAIDPKTKIMYFIDCGERESALYAVDIETAAASKLYDMEGNKQFIGLYIVEDSTPATVPAPPAGAGLDFEAGSLSGKIRFNVPSTFYDGSEASGDVRYSITIDDGQSFSGATAWSKAESVDVAFQQPGRRSFSIKLTNATGDSPETKLSAWIGPDAPSPVTAASAAWADGRFTIKWTAPEAGVNGGWFDPSAVRYDVVRVNDGVKIADGISGTSCTDDVPEPVNKIVGYTYTITPICNGVSGEPVTTSKKSIGYIIPPYSNTFDNSSATGGYTVLDANKDSKKWGYNSSSACFRIQYSSSKDMDDYLFTPQLQLEAGRSYTFSFKARAHNNSDHEFVEGVISTGTSVASVKATIIEKTELVSKEWVTLSGTFTPETSGRYRFGFHAVSPKNSYYLYVDDLEISAGAGSAAPAAMSDFTVTPAADGSLKASVSMRTPSTDVGGAPISSLTKVELLRNGTIINTWEAPAVNTVLTYEDTEATAKNTLYTAMAYNAAGQGAIAQQNVFIGFDAPNAPTEVAAAAGSNTGEAVISWKAPETDLQGNKLSASNLTYTVVRRLDDKTETVVSGLTSCSFTDKAVSPDAEQQFYDYAVSAQTTGGSSQAAGSQLIPLGKPYAVPFSESFRNGRISSIWGLDSNNATAGWLLGQDTSIDGISSEDGDNGLVIMEALTKGSEATLYSGSIAIPAEGNPTLCLAYFNHDSRNTLDVVVAETGSISGKKLTTITLNPSAPEEWVNVPLSLDEFKGKNVQIYFTAKVVNTTVFIMDNIRIENRLDHDLAVRSLSLPARVVPGNGYEVVAMFENKGLNSASGYKVNLLLNGETVDSRTGADLAAGAAAKVSFPRLTSSSAGGKLDYQVALEFAADLNQDNNRSATYPARLVSPGFPVPGKPDASTDGRDVVLTWTEPDITSGAMQPVTESAEDFTPFSTGLAGSEVFDDYTGGWTMVDHDGVTPFDITSKGEPVIFPNCHRPVGFMVFDSSTLNLEEWSAHTGSRMFVSFASGYAPNDDWMISPLLPGDAQTVKLWAKSLTTLYGEETFEFLYSTTDTRLSSFTRVGDRKAAPDQWTEYSFDLPAGAKYFAIRCTSEGTFAFLVDDITFIPAHPNEGLELSGFNLYRNGDLINSEPLKETRFKDENVADGNRAYRLTALYNRGESELSEEVEVKVSGADTVLADGLSVSADDRTITIRGAAGKEVRVATASGILLHSGVSATDEIRISAGKGIYAVRIGDRQFRINVK